MRLLSIGTLDPRFWKALTQANQAQLLAAVFFTFAALGPLVELLDFPPRTPWTDLYVIAPFAGFFGVAFIWASINKKKLIPIIIVVQVLLLISMDRWLPQTVPLPQEDIPTRVAYDAIAILIFLMLGYSFFIRFITTAGREHLTLFTEVELAQQLHTEIVPDICFEDEYLEIFGRTRPSREVGGDLIDLVIQEGRICLYLADVSGHGVSAGAVSGMLKSAVRTHMQGEWHAETVASAVNKVLNEITPTHVFATLSVLEFADEEIHIAGAGALPLLMVNSEHYAEVPADSPPTGLFESADFQRRVIQPPPRTLLALVTDGFTEVVNDRGEEFTLDRVGRFLADNRTLTLERIYGGLNQACESFGRRHDDQTLVLARLKDPKKH